MFTALKGFTVINLGEHCLETVVFSVVTLPTGRMLLHAKALQGEEHPRTKTAQTGLNRLFFHCINACISRSSASKLSSAPQDFSAPSGDPQQLLVLPEPLQNCLLWTPGARLLDHGAAARTLSPSNQDLLEIRSPLW